MYISGPLLFPAALFAVPSMLVEGGGLGYYNSYKISQDAIEYIDNENIKRNQTSL